MFERLRERILRNSAVHEPTGCRLWTGRKNNVGYGVLSVRIPGYRQPRKIFAHGAHSLACISRACCEWTHIRAATPASNMRDKWREKPGPRRRTLRIEFPPTHTISRRIKCRTNKPRRPPPQSRNSRKPRQLSQT